jgi:FkbM family methyltransferase
MRTAWIQVKRFGILTNILGLVGAVKLVIQLFLHKPLIQVYVKGVTAPLYLRPNNSDVFVLMQTFWYRGVDIQLSHPPAVIIDGGANIGLTTVSLANQYSDARIIAVEPDADNCRIFSLNTATYSQVQLIQGAIWDKESELTISDSQVDSWTIQVTETTTDIFSSGIPGMTIAQIMSKHELEKVDLLKLDIEGAEKRVFEADANLNLDRIGCVLVETHDRFVTGSEKAVLQAAQKYGFQIAKSGEYLVLCRY